MNKDRILHKGCQSPNGQGKHDPEVDPSDEEDQPYTGLC